MNAQEIRNAYLKFFAERGHAVIPRAQLMPQNDPTTLFTGSGMQPIIPYLLGETHPNGIRLVDSQTCLRAQDIDEVGDNRHTTFFEMLGNWSLGDYFKSEQITWMWEFLSDVVELDISRVYVTCYSGNEEFDIPKDTEAGEIWAKLYADKGLSNGQAEIGTEEAGYQRGMKDGERIFYYDGSKNWWSRGGSEAKTPVGDPCGPDSEMFYDFGTPHNPEFGERCHPNCDCGRFMEIGNNVFMAYKKVDNSTFEKLEKPNVDHGSGLERIAAAKLDDPDVFKISLMWPIIEKLQELSGNKYDSHTQSMRVIADHLRAATFLAVDGCVPSNKEAGYVMRRLIRRAIRFAFDLGVEQDFLQEVVPVIADMYHDDFPEVARRRDEIINVLVKEEKVFRQTLRKGQKELENMLVESDDTSSGAEKGKQLSGGNAFKLYDTFGYPKELTAEMVAISGNTLSPDWLTEFDDAMQEQRKRSQTAAKGAFAGGLEGHEDIHKKYHTATHLMYRALRMVLGEHVIQRGSNITGDRLRFDFSHQEKMTPEQKTEVERIVNEAIERDLLMSWRELPTDEAFANGALGAFGDKYGDTVKVYSAGEGDDLFSLEICGGPHVDRTGQLAEDGKTFKIIKEESSSAGIRRIKAKLV